MNGHSSLSEKQQFEPEKGIVVAEVEPYIADTSHLKYLEQPAFHRYLKMHKITLGSSGYVELERIGLELEQEYMPRFLDSAAWAYAEIAMYDSSRDKIERLDLLARSHELWETALEREIQLSSYEYSAVFEEPDSPYRVATSIAFAPLMNALVSGDVNAEVRANVLSDVSRIANDVSDQITKTIDCGYRAEANAYTGLLHELNALMALLYIDDPRYMPLPATARADTGYYHREQTHDITVINQHWGTVKKVLPVEIKASPSRRDRQRYNALIVRGKMHLTPDGVDPRKATRAFYDHAGGVATVEQMNQNDRLANGLRDMLRVYQKGGSPRLIALNSLTRFYDSKKDMHKRVRVAV